MRPKSASGRQPQPPIPRQASGLVVTKADLVAALRGYILNLVDVTPMDGDRFLLSTTAMNPADESREERG